MRRREFIRLIGVAVLSWPRLAIGQQAGKAPTIGFLSSPRGALQSHVCF